MLLTEDLEKCMVNEQDELRILPQMAWHAVLKTLWFSMLSASFRQDLHIMTREINRKANINLLLIGAGRVAICVSFWIVWCVVSQAGSVKRFF